MTHKTLHLLFYLGVQICERFLKFKQILVWCLLSIQFIEWLFETNNIKNKANCVSSWNSSHGNKKLDYFYWNIIIITSDLIKMKPSEKNFLKVDCIFSFSVVSCEKY